MNGIHPQTPTREHNVAPGVAYIHGGILQVQHIIDCLQNIPEYGAAYSSCQAGAYPSKCAVLRCPAKRYNAHCTRLHFAPLATCNQRPASDSAQRLLHMRCLALPRVAAQEHVDVAAPRNSVLSHMQKATLTPRIDSFRTGTATTMIVSERLPSTSMYWGTACGRAHVVFTRCTVESG